MATKESTDWFSLAIREHGYLQAAIDKFDRQSFQIRNWSITLAGVLFTVSLSAKIASIALASVIAVLFFAFLEIVNIDMTQCAIKRSNYLEDLVNDYRKSGQEPPGYNFGVGQAFKGAFEFKQIPSLVFVRRRLHVTAFYIGLLIVNICGAIVVAVR
jgi:hypothetical protein